MLPPLLILQQRLQRIRRESRVPRPIPTDLDGLADELELLGAKVNTLAVELRVAPTADSATVARTMRYLEECYQLLATAIEPETPRWSRA